MIGLAPVAAVAAPALAKGGMVHGSASLVGEVVSPGLLPGEFTMGQASVAFDRGPMVIKRHVEFADGTVRHIGLHDRIVVSCEWPDDASPEPRQPMTDGDGI
jgi:hypothetical protein